MHTGDDMRMSDAGKGGDTRPRVVSDDEWDDNWDVAFRRDKKNDSIMRHRRKNPNKEEDK